jgi:hypothetical protein
MNNMNMRFVSCGAFSSFMLHGCIFYRLKTFHAGSNSGKIGIYLCYGFFKVSLKNEKLYVTLYL